MIPFLVCFGSLEMRELPIDFLNLQQYILPFLTVRLEDLENISFHFVPSKRNGTYNTQTYGLLEFANSLGSVTELIQEQALGSVIHWIVLAENIVEADLKGQQNFYRRAILSINSQKQLKCSPVKNLLHFQIRLCRVYNV